MSFLGYRSSVAGELQSFLKEGNQVKGSLTIGWVLSLNQGNQRAPLLISAVYTSGYLRAACLVPRTVLKLLHKLLLEAGQESAFSGGPAGVGASPLGCSWRPEPGSERSSQVPRLPSKLLTSQGRPGPVPGVRPLPPSLPHSPGRREKPTLSPSPKPRRDREEPGQLPGEAAWPRSRGVSSRGPAPRAPARPVYARRHGNAAGPVRGVACAAWRGEGRGRTRRGGGPGAGAGRQTRPRGSQPSAAPRSIPPPPRRLSLRDAQAHFTDAETEA